jgi:hypothetical protein
VVQDWKVNVTAFVSDNASNCVLANDQLADWMNEVNGISDTDNGDIGVARDVADDSSSSDSPSSVSGNSSSNDSDSEELDVENDDSSVLLDEMLPPDETVTAAFAEAFKLPTEAIGLPLS